MPELQGRRIQRVYTRLQVPVLSDVGQLTGAIRIRSEPTPGVPAQASGAQVTPMMDGPRRTATRQTGRLPRIALAGIAQMGHSSRHSPEAQAHEQPQEVKESASDEEMDSSGGSGPRETASETKVVVRHRGTVVAAEVLSLIHI